MLISKCISLLLSSVISVNSSIAWMPPVQNEVAAPVVEEIIIEEPVTIPEDIISEPEVEEETVEPIIEEPTPQPVLGISDEDIKLIALVTMAEAEGESEKGKRLVIDVILNRYESPRFSDTIKGVIYTKNAFECMWNGRVNRCYVRDDIYQLVIEEIQNRTNSNIHYFRTNHYHNFGVHVVQEGNHYFSTY